MRSSRNFKNFDDHIELRIVNFRFTNLWLACGLRPIFEGRTPWCRVAYAILRVHWHCWSWRRNVILLDASPLRGGFTCLTTRLSSALKSSRVERTTCTLRTDTDITKSWDLAHKTRVVISAIKTHTYIHTTSIHWFIRRFVAWTKVYCYDWVWDCALHFKAFIG